MRLALTGIIRVLPLAETLTGALAMFGALHCACAVMVERAMRLAVKSRVPPPPPRFFKGVPIDLRPTNDNENPPLQRTTASRAATAKER